MTDHELPVFPAEAPPGLTDPASAIALLDPVLDDLASMVEIAEEDVDGPTPCRNYTVGQLRHHVLGWLQFFAAALNDPDGQSERIDPQSPIPPDQDPAAIVRAAAGDIKAAIEAGVGRRLVVMSQARMRGDAVVAMALGEYIVHGWDLATATGRGWSVTDEAADQARIFLQATVAPEYRGEDSGFFGEEVRVADDAPALDRLLGFAGRDPDWRP